MVAVIIVGVCFLGIDENLYGVRDLMTAENLHNNTNQQRYIKGL